MPLFVKLSALVVLSTALALGAAEAGLRAVGWRTLPVNPDQLHLWRHDPLLGWAHRPGREGVFETDQFRTHVRINRKGLRDREHSYGRPDDTKRILVIGDSFAWGFGVEEAERFSELLEASMGIEVINAGISGYSTDQSLLWLKSEGARYDYDFVVGVFPGNDHYDNHLARNYFIYNKPRFEIVGDSLALRGVPVPKPPRRLLLERYLRRRSVLANRLSRSLRGSYERALSRSEKALALHTEVFGQPAPPWALLRRGESGDPFGLMRAIVDEVRSVARQNGAGFMMVSTPRYWIGDEMAGGSYEDLVAAIRSAGILLLDVESLPGFDHASMVIPDDGHWSPEGHVFLAEELAGIIEQQQLLGGGNGAHP